MPNKIGAVGYLEAERCVLLGSAGGSIIVVTTIGEKRAVDDFNRMESESNKCKPVVVCAIAVIGWEW